MNATSKLIVKSHVARDLLQSAGLFKTDKLVVWEYVSNGLQYIGAGTKGAACKRNKHAPQAIGRLSR
jgi:hypothetical protein